MISLDVRLTRQPEPPDPAAAAGELRAAVAAHRTLKLPVTAQPEPPGACMLTCVKRGARSATAVHREFVAAAGVIVREGDKLGWHATGAWVTGGAGTRREWTELTFDAPPGPPPSLTMPPFDPAPFEGLYGMEPHIRLIYDMLREAVDSGFVRRHHVLLHGPPGCGKTELLRAFARWLGPGSSWHVDAVTMSKVGIERELLQRSKAGTLPPLLILEEIEKMPVSRLAPLLGVMDGRGQISRVNGRDGEQVADARIFVLATCNDLAKLRKWGNGALASRFEPYHLPRPDRFTLAKILSRSCERLDWVAAVVDYMYDELHDTDPRRGQRLLAGGERLLDGSFFDDYRKTRG